MLIEGDDQASDRRTGIGQLCAILSRHPRVRNHGCVAVVGSPTRIGDYDGRWEGPVGSSPEGRSDFALVSTGVKASQRMPRLARLRLVVLFIASTRIDAGKGFGPCALIGNAYVW